MPATRLKPIPFTEPERIARWIEEEPSLLESGLRIVAKKLPLPAQGASLLVDLLAIDGEGRATTVLLRESIGAAALEAGVSSHAWLRQALPALRLLCPALAEARGEARMILIGGRVEPAAEMMAAGLGQAGPEILRASLFELTWGVALSFEPAAGAIAPRDLSTGRIREASPPAGAPASRRQERPGADPLAGIPLTVEEIDEFRRLTSRPPARSERSAGKESAPGRSSEEASAAAMVEN